MAFLTSPVKSRVPHFAAGRRIDDIASLDDIRMTSSRPPITTKHTMACITNHFSCRSGMNHGMMPSLESCSTIVIWRLFKLAMGQQPNKQHIIRSQFHHSVNYSKQSDSKEEVNHYASIQRVQDQEGKHPQRPPGKDSTLCILCFHFALEHSQI